MTSFHLLIKIMTPFKHLQQAFLENLKLTRN